MTKSNQVCSKYSPKCVEQFLKDYHTWRVPQDFHRSHPPQTTFPTFHCRMSSFCCLPSFSSLVPSKSPGKDPQDFNRSWKTSSHVFFYFKQNYQNSPPQRYLQFQQTLISLIKQNKGFNRIIYKEFHLLITSFFSILTSQEKSPRKGTCTIPQNKSRRQWSQLLTTNFLSFNPLKYESNHQKQDLLITIDRISHC